MKLFVFCFITCILCGCRSMTYDDESCENIKEILINPEEVEAFWDLSVRLNDSVDIISLEVTDECLISAIGKFEYYKDYIFISDRTNAKIFMFSSTGKFIKSIGNFGKGPGRYSSLGDFSFKGDSIVVQDAFNDSYIIYDFFSDAYREVSCDVHGVEFVLFDNIAYVISNYYQSKYGSYNLFCYDFNTGNLIEPGISFQEEWTKLRSAYGLKRYSDKYNDTGLLIYPLNDTIYTINKEGVFPSYLVHFTERSLPEELNIKNEELYRYVHKNRYLKGLEFVQHTENYLLGYYIDGNFRYILYDKRTSKVVVGKQMIFNALGGIPVYDFATADNNVFFALYSSDFLLSYWSVVKDKCKSHYNKEKMDLLVSTINEDSNPVLLKWYLKN